MTLAQVAVALGLLAACSKREEVPAKAPPAPLGEGDLPDILSLDWKALHYDLGSLGNVVATGGRAEFRVIDDDDQLRATQDPSVTSMRAGFLDLDPPRYADLDGDGHDEALIPFELASAQADETPHVFGVFVYTLRGGEPMQLGTITTPAKGEFTVQGATITAGTQVWRWDATSRHLAPRAAP